MLLPILPFLAGSVGAIEIFEQLSFGHLLPIATKGGPIGDNVPNWDISISEPLPLVYDDRISLTHGWAGNKAGAIWSKKTLDTETFMLDMEFHAGGPEDGGGDLQLWLVKDKPEWPLDLANVYAAEKFEGLGIIIDQYGGQGGSVRGFMNDGSVNYSSRASVDYLAFGHCYYPYRNLGMPSKLRMRQTDLALMVEMDDELCFKTENKLPKGLHLGLVGTSALEPDEWEIWKFVVNDGHIEIPTAESVKKLVDKLPRHRDVSDPLPLPKGPPPRKRKQPEESTDESDPMVEAVKEIREDIQRDFLQDAAQFEEVDNRPSYAEVNQQRAAPAAAQQTQLGDQSSAATSMGQDRVIAASAPFEEDEDGSVILNQQTFNELFDAIGFLADKLDSLHQEINGVEKRMSGKHEDSRLAPGELARRVEHIEGVVMQVQKDIESRDYMDHLNSLHDVLEATQKHIAHDSGVVNSSASRLNYVLYTVVGAVLFILGRDAFNKWRRAKAPNKIL